MIAKKVYCYGIIILYQCMWFMQHRMVINHEYEKHVWEQKCSRHRVRDILPTLFAFLHFYFIFILLSIFIICRCCCYFLITLSIFSQELNIFYSVLQNVFYSLPKPPVPPYHVTKVAQDFENVLLQHTQERGLVPHQPWISKINQLRTLSKVHHGKKPKEGSTWVHTRDFSAWESVVLSLVDTSRDSALASHWWYHISMVTKNKQQLAFTSLRFSRCLIKISRSNWG